MDAYMYNYTSASAGYTLDSSTGYCKTTKREEEKNTHLDFTYEIKCIIIICCCPFVLGLSKPICALENIAE